MTLAAAAVVPPLAWGVVAGRGRGWAAVRWEAAAAACPAGPAGEGPWGADHGAVVPWGEGPAAADREGAGRVQGVRPAGPHRGADPAAVGPVAAGHGQGRLEGAPREEGAPVEVGRGAEDREAAGRAGAAPSAAVRAVGGP